MLIKEPKINNYPGQYSYKCLDTWRLLGPISLEFLQANCSDISAFNFEDHSQEFAEITDCWGDGGIQLKDSHGTLLSYTCEGLFRKDTGKLNGVAGVRKGNHHCDQHLSGAMAL